MNNLRKLRLEHNLKQKDIAKIVNKGQEACSAWELGKTQPDINDLIKLSKFFGCSVDYIIGNEGEDGTIYVMGNELSDDENYLVDSVRQLNKINKEVVYKYVEFLLEQQKQKKL